MPLSEAQREAVKHKDGPALILAGPGSGKTTVITQRTKALIEDYGVLPVHILVVTFTRTAADQMKKRFLSLCGITRTPVRFGTFHSVFYEILKYAYHLHAENIAGEDQKLRILQETIRSLQPQTEDEADFLHDVAAEISTVKNERIPLEHYYASSIPEETFRRLYIAYQKRMEREGLLDYDDLMVWTYELLSQRGDILQGWQKRYRYIAVDEFQDINQIQYEIIRMLAAPEDNLFVVGDDDQSIYRFRGAKPEIMLHFPKDYPDAKKIFLDKNFRCPGTVIRLAERVIAGNAVRFPKKILQVKKDGAAVERMVFQNQTQESLGVIKRIREYLADGRHYRDIAVLYRSNAEAGVLSGKLLEYNIPFFAKDTLPNLYGHWIAKEIRAYLRIAQGSRERADFLQILNRPKRYLSRECLDRPCSFEGMRLYYEEKPWILDRIDKLESDIRRLAGMDPYTAIHYIRHAVGYEEYLREYAAYRKMKAEDLYEVLDRLAESAKGYKTHAAWFMGMEEYEKKLKEQTALKKTRQDAVTLSTLHGAKGLEFPVVFLIDVNDGVIPYKKALSQRDIEEERRMFYVGITRASERLHLYSVKEKYGKDMKPSPFLMQGTETP